MSDTTTVRWGTDATDITFGTDVTTIVGVEAAGPRGPAGADGPPGAPLTIKGSVATSADLPASGDNGDLWLAEDTGHGWAWTTTEWVDVGRVQGPQGDDGPQGDPTTVNGKTGASITLDAADVGADPAGTAAGLVASEVAAREAADALLTPLTDPRLTDERTPLDGSVTPVKLSGVGPSNVGADPAGAAASAVAAIPADATAATASLRTLGTGATQATAGNDGRLSDARTPTAHAASHASGGSDPVSPASIGAASAADLAAETARAEAAEALAVPASQLGAASGVATLDADGLLTAAQRPGPTITVSDTAPASPAVGAVWIDTGA